MDARDFRCEDGASRLLPGHDTSKRRHAIHLDIERPGPRVNEHEDARRRVFREITVIDGVERRKMRRSRHAIDIALDHLRERRASGFQTVLELSQHKFALSLEGDRLDLAALPVSYTHLR